MDNFFNPQTLLFFFGILAAVLVLGVLVAVHELGHLLMAKMCRIRVDIFSVGMGKAVWSRQFGETAYQIGWIPFGGYCAFGEESEESKDDPRSLANASFWAKFLTIIGGSLFNVLFAFFVLIAVFQKGFLENKISNTVEVSPTLTREGNEVPSPAWEAGLRSGDTITAISGKPIQYFNEITLALLLDKNASPTVSYTRKGVPATVPFTPIQTDSGIALLGVSPVYPVEIAEVLEDSPASRAGLRIGDILMKVNNVPVQYAHEAIEQLANSEKSAPAEGARKVRATGIGQAKDGWVSVNVKRGKEMLNFEIFPEPIDGQWRIGVNFTPPQIIPLIIKGANFGQSITLARQELGRQLDQMIVSIQKLFTGKVNVQKNLSGPVRIVSITGAIAQTLDFILLIRFAVMLSIALAVFNMLPFPGLDGGALVLNGVRAVFSRTHYAAAAEKAVSFVEHAGLIFLIAIAAFVFVNDIRNISAERKAAALIQKQNQP